MPQSIAIKTHKYTTNAVETGMGFGKKFKTNKQNTFKTGFDDEPSARRRFVH